MLTSPRDSLVSDVATVTQAVAVVGDLRRSAVGRLEASGIEAADANADWLLAHVTGVGRGALRDRTVLTADQLTRFEAVLARRCERVPLQHLTGIAGFRYLDLQVGPGVFVPRPETETLVDLAILGLAQVQATATAAGRSGLDLRPRIVDLCTGSAAVALSLATELDGVDVWALEYDADALIWAQRNVDSHRGQVDRAQSKLRIISGDITEPITVSQLSAEAGDFDLVVANPPYVPTGAVPCDPEVRDYDPAIALYGGTDGLDVVRAIVAAAAAMLRPGGFLAIEHGDRQGEDGPDASVPRLLRRDGRFGHIADHVDLSQRPRVTTAVRF